VLDLPRMANHGRLWFVGSILIISFFTYALAVYIGAILKFIQNFFRFPSPLPGGGESTSKKKDPNKAPPKFWRDAGVQGVLRWMRKNCLVSDWLMHGDGKEEQKEDKCGGLNRIRDNWLVSGWRKKEGKVKEKEKVYRRMSRMLRSWARLGLGVGRGARGVRASRWQRSLRFCRLRDRCLFYYI
jgi:hypothetical protein